MKTKKVMVKMSRVDARNSSVYEETDPFEVEVPAHLEGGFEIIDWLHDNKVTQDKWWDWAYKDVEGGYELCEEEE